MHGSSEVRVELDMAAADGARVLGSTFEVRTIAPNIIACGGSAKSGAGATIYVFSPAGALVEKHPAPADMPMRVAFGDADLGGLYLKTGGGEVYRSKDTARKGVRR